MDALWRQWLYEEGAEAGSYQVRPWVRQLSFALPVALFVSVGTLLLSFGTLVTGQATVDLRVGDVARQDIAAPRSMTYESRVLTDQAQQAAIRNVDPVYKPNPDVTRTRIRLAGDVTQYVTAVRADPYALEEQLVNDMQQIEALDVPQDIWLAVLELSDGRWELIDAEISALVERTMQGDIRDDNIFLVRNNLVNSVAGRFSGVEEQIVVAIASDLIEPNSFYDEESTLSEQEVAASQVLPQQKTYEENQLIVRSGTIVTALEMEALDKFDLLNPSGIRVQMLIGALLAMLLTTLILWLYVERFFPNIRHNPQMFILIAVLFLLFLASVHLFSETGANQPYLYPAAALGMLLTTLVGAELAIMSVSLLAILVGLTQPGDLAIFMVSYVFVGSVVGVLSLRHVDKLNSYFVAGAIVSVTNLLVMLVFSLMQEEVPDITEMFSRVVVTITSGLFAAGIAIVALYIITNALNLTTNLKLIELMDSKHPLLQRLLREAPGTYQHSLQVGNLSELAAEAIGANASLVRVAAMYHDIGKMLNPFYFGENTADGMNPHADLNDPYKSARVIIGHVIEGDRLARRYKLPRRIRDFILEHHGTTQALFFYNQALERADESGAVVKVEEFTYPGPAPRSRETAIMMLADGCESATRAKQPAAKADIEEVVNTIFELRLGEGQLDNSGLTLNDLKSIRDIFIETLQAMYHPRIAYKMRPREENVKPQLSSGIVRHLEGSGEEGERKTEPKPPKRTLIEHEPVRGVDQEEAEIIQAAATDMARTPAPAPGEEKAKKRDKIDKIFEEETADLDNSAIIDNRQILHVEDMEDYLDQLNDPPPTQEETKKPKHD